MALLPKMTPRQLFLSISYLLMSAIAIGYFGAEGGIPSTQLLEKEIFTKLGIYEVVGAPGKHVNHEVVFAIRQRNENRIDKILTQVSDPSSPNYAKYLTRVQVAELTTNKASTEAVVSYLMSEGVSVVRPTAFGEYVSATATIGHWEQLLQGEFVTVSPLKSISITMKSIPVAYRMLQYTLPAALTEHVVTVFNTVQTPTFSNHFLPHNDISFDEEKTSSTQLRNKLNPPPVPGVAIERVDALHQDQSSWLFGYTYPKFLNSYYNIFKNQAAAGAAASTTTTAGDPITTAKPTTTTTTQAVFAAVGQTLALNDQRLFQLSFQLPLEHPMGTEGGHIINGSCQTVRSCGEANLDVQYIMATAQNVPTVFWYADHSFTDWIVQAADAEDPPHVISISYGTVEAALSSVEKMLFDFEAKKLGIQGVTILASSGDTGVAGDAASFYGLLLCGYNPDFPASSPFVTSIGATQGPELGTKEVACEARNSGFTTGGGFSNFYATPPWQKRAVSHYFGSITGKRPYTDTAKRGVFPSPVYNEKGRGFPDLAMLGVNFLMVDNATWYPASGTSASTPVVAGMISLINSERLAAGKPTLGFLNPAIYMFNGSFANDIVDGANRCLQGGKTAPCCREGFTAMTGWDPVTGFGSVDFQRLYDLFTGLPGDLNVGYLDGDEDSAYEESSESETVPPPNPTGTMTRNGVPVGGRQTRTKANEALFSLAILLVALMVVVVVAGRAAMVYNRYKRRQHMGNIGDTRRVVVSYGAINFPAANEMTRAEELNC